jgi:NRAMP (natural resistance-associated macrophage protein)-like metal ion transporter
VAVSIPFGPLAERRSVLDRAHRGDIEGAFGRVRVYDTGPRLSLARRLGTLLAIMGPGLVVMAADIDAGTLSVFAQAGQNYGLTLVWVLLLLAPVLFVNQEMVARLGAVTGAGHARLIFERFGRRWGAFALGDLLVLNLATIVTEFIGVDLALGYFGVSRYVSVPLAAVALVAITATGSFRRWERTMYVLVAVNLIAVPLALTSHASAVGVARAAVPGVGGAVDPTTILFILALVGTTVSPWQLFFQQSNVVDKRITGRWLAYERADTLIGAVVFTISAVAVVVTCATAFTGSPLHGAFSDAGSVAHGLASRLGPAAGALFALVLLNASILGAGCVTLSTSYALGDVLGIKHSLHRGWRDARLFHGSFAASTALAAAVVLVPGAPLGLVTTAVQAFAGVLLPSATVFLVLLCNDRAVLGPWVNPRWLNALATLVVGVLLVLSALLTVTTLAPQLDMRLLAATLAGALVAVLALLGTLTLRGGRPERFGGTRWERLRWSMPPLDRLAAPSRSRARAVALTVLRVYVTVAGALLVLRVIELAITS